MKTTLITGAAFIVISAVVAAVAGLATQSYSIAVAIFAIAALGIIVITPATRIIGSLRDRIQLNRTAIASLVEEQRALRRRLESIERKLDLEPSQESPDHSDFPPPPRPRQRKPRL